MDFKAIQDLLKFINKSDLTEVVLEEGDLKIKVKRRKDEDEPKTVVVERTVTESTPAPQVQAQPISQPVNQPTGETQPKAEAGGSGENLAANQHIITSPMIGTFYASPSPDKPVFVQVGDSIKAGDTICIIEAMKLFNEIESEVAGKVVKVMVENAQPVEYDQPLFIVELA